MCRQADLTWVSRLVSRFQIVYVEMRGLVLSETRGRRRVCETCSYAARGDDVIEHFTDTPAALLRGG